MGAILKAIDNIKLEDLKNARPEDLQGFINLAKQNPYESNEFKLENINAD
ncbi:MAG: hypothetical protein LBU14_03420 [Candidatus Peribacteria bacterium]|nr:hypothetical protein [Candidatus Peribacteria bacterium]